MSGWVVGYLEEKDLTTVFKMTSVYTINSPIVGYFIQGTWKVTKILSIGYSSTSDYYY